MDKAFATIGISWLCMSAITLMAHAELSFSVDSVAAEFDLVSDLQDGLASREYFAESNYNQVQDYLSSLRPKTTDILYSELIEVCPLLSVPDPSGIQYYFRSNHVQGDLDWMITITRDDPIKVYSISLVSPREGNALGQPGILPPLPVDGQIEDVIIPDAQMPCMSPKDRVAAQQEITRACKELGKQCDMLRD